MVYLGVVDPDTGEIFGKGVDYNDQIISDGGFKIRNLGDVLVAYSSLSRIGLREDLHSTFGDDGDCILALAIAQVIHPSDIRDSIFTIDSSCIPEILGLDRNHLSSRLYDSVKMIDRRSKNGFFESRMNRVHGKMMLFGKTITMFERDANPDLNIRSGGNWKFGDTNLQFFAEPDGCLTAYNYHTGSTVGLEHAPNGFNSSDGLMVVADTYFSSPSAIADLVMNRVEFAVLADRDSKMINHLVDSFIIDHEQVDTFSFGGESFSVMKRSVGISASADGWKYILDDEDGFIKCDYSFNAFIFKSPAVARSESRFVNDVVSIYKNLEMYDDEYCKMVATIRPIEKIVRLVKTDHGMKIHIRRDEVTKLKRRAGITVIFTSSDDCMDLVSMFSKRYYFLQDLQCFLDGVKGRWNDGARSSQSLSTRFIRFLSAMIRSSIRNISDGSDYKVDQILKMASSYSVVTIGERSYRSSISLKTSCILDMFGIDVSDPYNKKGRDLTELLDPNRSSPDQDEI